MSLYLKVISLLLFLAVVFGFVAPFMISAANTEIVLAGIALLIVVVPVVIIRAMRNIFYDVKRRGTQSKEQSNNA